MSPARKTTNAPDETTELPIGVEPGIKPARTIDQIPAVMAQCVDLAQTTRVAMLELGSTHDDPFIVDLANAISGLAGCVQAIAKALA